MKQRVLIFGASGHGKVVADVASRAGTEVIGFIDDDPTKRASGPWGLPVLSWHDCVAKRSALGALSIALGVGDNRARERCQARIAGEGFELATLVHPTAVVSSRSRLGAGTVVMALVAVNPDAEVGEGVILNTGSIVEHDCRVGRFAHLSPQAALGGGVIIGERAHLGLGAVVLPLITVGADARVGAGAVVNRPVGDGETVVGVPARPIRPGGQR